MNNKTLLSKLKSLHYAGYNNVSFKHDMVKTQVKEILQHIIKDIRKEELKLDKHKFQEGQLCLVRLQEKYKSEIYYLEALQ